MLDQIAQPTFGKKNDMTKIILALNGIFFSICSFSQITEGLVMDVDFTYGSVYDKVGTNNGFVFGATPTEDRFGNENMAYQFDGNDYIHFFHNNEVSLDLMNQISISVWIKPDDFNSGLRSIVSKWNDATSEQFGLFQDGLNGLYAVRNINTIGTSVPITPSADGWYHVVFTLNKSTNVQNLYINNVLVSTVTSAGSYTNTTNSTYLSVGAQYNDLNGTPGVPDRFFIGTIDDIQIFDTVLTSSQVNTLYSADKSYCADFEVDVINITPTTSNDGEITFTVNGGHAPYYFSVDGGSLNAMTSGKLCGQAFEGNNFTITAPGTANFTAVNFASYGSPTGDCGEFIYGNCNAATSYDVAASEFLGWSSGTFEAGNGTFGDPCFGTGKNGRVMLSYAENITLDNLAAGSYLIEVVDSFGCVASANIVVLNFGASVNEFTAEHIEMYPNPASQNVNFTTSTKTYFEVFTASGSLVMEFIVNGTETIDISMLENGIYFVKTQNGSVAKLVIER